MPRVEVRVSDDLKRDLDAFASTDATTQSEIVRRAMALYALARAEAQHGGQVILKSGSGAERQVVAF